MRFQWWQTVLPECDSKLAKVLLLKKANFLEKYCG